MGSLVRDEQPVHVHGEPESHIMRYRVSSLGENNWTLQPEQEYQFLYLIYKKNVPSVS